MKPFSYGLITVLWVFLIACSEPTHEEKCIQQGGEFRINEESDGFDEGACYKPTIDAGKTCADSAMCQSFCVGKSASATQGSCYKETPFSGCAYVFNGPHLMEVCQ